MLLKAVILGGTPPGPAAAISTRVEKSEHKTIAAGAKRGYGLLILGREPASEAATFHEQIVRSAAEFGGPFCVVIARGDIRREGPNPRSLVRRPRGKVRNWRLEWLNPRGGDRTAFRSVVHVLTARSRPPARSGERKGPAELDAI